MSNYSFLLESLPGLGYDLRCLATKSCDKFARDFATCANRNFGPLNKEFASKKFDAPSLEFTSIPFGKTLQPPTHQRNPDMNPAETTAKLKYTDYSNVPWIRKSGTNSLFLILHLLTCGAIPFLLITCVVLVTGHVYYNQKESNGDLKVWSPANKIVAFLLLIPSLLVIGIFGFAIIGGFLRSLAG